MALYLLGGTARSVLWSRGQLPTPRAQGPFSLDSTNTKVPQDPLAEASLREAIPLALHSLCHGYKDLHVQRTLALYAKM